LLILKVDDEITLKELEIETAEKLFGLIDTNREYLREWLSWVDNTSTIDDTIFYIQNLFKQDLYSGRYVLEVRYNNELAGLVDYHNGDSINLKAEIGYWLAESFQGKGIMTKACLALIDYGFKKAGLNRVTIKCAEGNKKSQAIPIKLNFKMEGIEREGQYLYGRFHDLLVFSMLKNDWK
jgi:ribosomal-protein-serine acetyltransferase